MLNNLLPLVPFFTDNGAFYLLALGLKHVRLYECSRDYISEVGFDEKDSGRLEDVVGRDTEKKSLQYRPGHGGNAGAMFHGQGSGKDDRDKEAEKFFRAVDQAVHDHISEGGAPWS